MRLAAVIGVVLLSLSGCVSSDSGIPEKDEVLPDEDDRSHEINESQNKEDDESNLTEHWELSVTDVSAGINISLPSLIDYSIGNCLDSRADSLDVEVEWNPIHSYSNLEFNLLYPSEPQPVRGAPPLLWHHELTEQDHDACPELLLRADPTGINILIEQKVDIWITFNGTFT